MTPISYFMALSAVLFAIGVAGVLIRRNVIVMFMSVSYTHLTLPTICSV